MRGDVDRVQKFGKCSKLFCVRKLVLSLFLVGSTLSYAATGVDQQVLSQIPQRMKSFVDRQTVAGAVTLVAHGSDIATQLLYIPLPTSVHDAIRAVNPRPRFRGGAP